MAYTLYVTYDQTKNTYKLMSSTTAIMTLRELKRELRDVITIMKKLNKERYKRGLDISEYDLYAIAFIFKLIEIAELLKGIYSLKHSIHEIVKALLMLFIEKEGDISELKKEDLKECHELISLIVEEYTYEDTKLSFKDLYELYKEFMRTGTLHYNILRKLLKYKI